MIHIIAFLPFFFNYQEKKKSSTVFMLTFLMSFEFHNYIWRHFGKKSVHQLMYLSKYFAPQYRYLCQKSLKPISDFSDRVSNIKTTKYISTKKISCFYLAG